jgi:beta-carotene hydroxylase
MLPRNPADYRTLVWALAMPVVLVTQLTHPELVRYLWPLGFYLAMAAGTMAHNHNHCPTFASKRMNAFYANWISVFYGYPAFAWVPTHNLNHHKHVNREGDATITWRHTNRNAWWVAITYFFVSSYYQSEPIKQYLRKAKEHNPRLYRQILTQYATWIAMLLGTMVASVTMNGAWLGLKTWFVAFGLPSVFGTWSMMWFNYMQHVHTDPWSKHNHSRNFYGFWMNFLVFNNGYHAAHHEHPGAHWSELPALHAKIVHDIHPELNRRSFWYWIFRAYILTAFLPRFETKQIGRAPFDPPQDSMRSSRAASRPLTDSVDALEAGNNAQMA